MIKIQINNLQQKKQEYLNEILDTVAFRISVLEKSLSHLNGSPIDFIAINFQNLNPVTRRIISIVGNGNMVFADGPDYITKVSNYLFHPNNLGTINIPGLLHFCQNILASNNLQLSELLVCEANELINLNLTILNQYGINTVSNLSVIKLAFDYSYENIATEIKKYFRTNTFVTACPYCNKTETKHHVNAAGEVVESFQLDHFYDKATFPLLAYSFFNLVPSDHTCNTLNKHDTEFNDTDHLNPYYRGYIDRFKFEPIGMSTAFEASSIKINIIEPQGTPIYRQVNGINQPNDEIGEIGNLNVFKIRSKYNHETRRTKDIFEKLHSNNKNLKHIHKYLKSLTGLNRTNSYVEWYKDKINSSFYPSTFNSTAFSKFCRDIHDHYYSINKTVFNKYIITLIEQNS